MFKVIWFSSESFYNETIEHFIDLSDLNAEPSTEIFLGSTVDKCKTQLRICRGTTIYFDYCLGCKINKTAHAWYFSVISYMNENIILLFYYIYFILVLRFTYFFRNKESVVFNFLDGSFLSYTSGCCHENQPLIGPVIY